MSGFEVVKDYCVAVNVYGRELLVSPSTDTVIRFNNHEYDHLRYLNPEAQQMTFEFLGQSALGELVGLGIPDTRERLKISHMELEAYIAWHEGENIMDFEREFDRDN